jgi:hypothetical protein
MSEKEFQLFHPIGGVLARPFDGDDAVWEQEPLCFSTSILRGSDMISSAGSLY